MPVPEVGGMRPFSLRKGAAGRDRRRAADADGPVAAFAARLVGGLVRLVHAAGDEPGGVLVDTEELRELHDARQSAAPVYL